MYFWLQLTIAEDAQTDCFSASARLIGDIQFQTFQLIMKPLANFEDNVLCTNMQNRSSSAQLQIGVNATSAVFVTSQLIENVNLSAPEVLYNFKNYSNMTFTALSAQRNIQYVIYFGTSQSIKTVGSLTEMSLIQRNATTCWKTIDMEYDLNASDSAIFIHLDPATCFVPQKISMFFEYKRQPWLSWVTIPLPVGNIPNSNEKIDYVHDNFKEIVVKWNDLNEQSLKNYKTFYDDFIKTRCTQMRIRFVYQDEGLDANIIGDFLTVNHKNSKNIIHDNNFRNTASSDQIIIYYDYEEVISALKNEYQLGTNIRYIHSTIYMYTLEQQSTVMAVNNKGVQDESIVFVDIFKIANTYSANDTQSYTLYYYIEFIDENQSIITGLSINQRLIFTCMAFSKVFVNKDELKLYYGVQNKPICQTIYNKKVDFTLVVSSMDQLNNNHLYFSGIATYHLNSSGNNILKFNKYYHIENSSTTLLCGGMSQCLNQFVKNTLVQNALHTKQVLLMNDFELVTIENVVFDGVGKEFVVYVSVSGTLVFLLACGTAWVIIKDFFTSEA